MLILLHIISPLNTVTEIAVSLVNIITDNTKTLPQKVFEIGKTLVTGLWDGIRQNTDIVIDLLSNLSDRMADMAQSAGKSLLDAFTSLISLLPEQISVPLQNIVNSIGTIVDSICADVMETFSIFAQNLIDAVISIGQNIQNTVTEIVVSLVSIISDNTKTLPQKVFEIGRSIIKALANGIRQNLMIVINLLVNLSNQMIATAQNAGNLFLDGILKIISLLPDKISVPLTNALNAVIAWGVNLKNKAIEIATTLSDTLIDGLRNLPDRMLEVGQNIVKGLWDGIMNLKDWLFSNVGDFCSGLLNDILNTFDIHSPSKKTAYIGQMLDAGLAEGVESNAETPAQAIRRMSNSILYETAVIPERLQTSQTIPDMGTSPIVNLELLGRLDSILQAIEHGQVLLLDGNVLVGQTIDRINTQLGNEQILAQRRNFG